MVESLRKATVPSGNDQPCEYSQNINTQSIYATDQCQPSLNSSKVSIIAGASDAGLWAFCQMGICGILLQVGREDHTRDGDD